MTVGRFRRAGTRSRLSLGMASSNRHDLSGRLLAVAGRRDFNRDRLWIELVLMKDGEKAEGKARGQYETGNLNGDSRPTCDETCDDNPTGGYGREKFKILIQTGHSGVISIVTHRQHLFTFFFCTGFPCLRSFRSCFCGLPRLTFLYPTVCSQSGRIYHQSFF